MENNIKKEAQAPKKHKRAPVTPLTEPALPLLTAAVTFVICLLILITDRFISPLGKSLLSPIIIQLVALLVPSYLAVILIHPEKPLFLQMRALGFHAVNAKHIFFLLFSMLFTICTSLLLALSFGGAHDLSHGITLLGTFIAGENEFSVSAPYLILTYAVLPALLEEFLFRGVLFSQLERISFPFAVTVTNVLYALFGFTLGGSIPMFFVGLMMVFVYYTTRSLWACVILHFIFNLYRLFMESNVCAYFLSSSNNTLLLLTAALAFLISAVLFLSEATRIFRNRAKRIAEKKQRSASKFANIRTVAGELRSMLAYIPSLVFIGICVTVFIAVVVINYIV